MFVSNVEGSAHLDVGLIDTTKNWLRERCNVDPECLFRADIERRLDGNWDIKWAYPEILSGADNLRILVETVSPGRVDTLRAALNSFMTAQYKQDYRVKFKQVDLEGRLLELFTDTSFEVVVSTDRAEWRAEPPSIWNDLVIVSRGARQGVQIATNQRSEEGLGVSRFLLSHFAAVLLPNLLIEGAPGQGKSTLAQYLCQIHRIRWLGIQEDLFKVSDDALQSGLRFPVRVDLRDLAVWLEGSDPFSSERRAPSGVIDFTLETFLARLIQHTSGGHHFVVADLVVLAERAPFLLVLDGFDEVADPRARSKVVEHVSAGIVRLRGFCPKLQAFITSRPTAFANSPGFDAAEFPRLTLTSLTRIQINTYADKWLEARHVEKFDREPFLTVLDERLEQPHIRDLARNPMQLAILLQLLRTKGSALPDKRTSLYEQYVSHFFDREAEKSSIVLEARDELLQIHGYLAWKLHSSAEEGNTEGRMELATVRNEVRSYLQREKHTTTTVEDLFTALVERVVMLVSRFQGTFEFEVQPLREYFAGRFLYETAPPSRPDIERVDTKIDRFDAIACNPYWANVARFFCGMFSKGELLDLADRVVVMTADPGLGRIQLPYRLASELLSDWVFSQTPKAMEQVASAVASERGLVTLSRRTIFDSSENITLSEKCGRSIVVEGAFRLLEKLITIQANRGDWITPIVSLLKSNATQTEITTWWLSKGKEVCKGNTADWHTIGCWLEATATMNVGEIVLLLESCDNYENALRPYIYEENVRIAFSSSRSELLLENFFFDSTWVWFNSDVPKWFALLAWGFRFADYWERGAILAQLGDFLERDDGELAGDPSAFQVRARGFMASMLSRLPDQAASREAVVEYVVGFLGAASSMWGHRTMIVEQANRLVARLGEEDFALISESPFEGALLDVAASPVAGFVEARTKASDALFWGSIVTEFRHQPRPILLLAFCQYASEELVANCGEEMFGSVVDVEIWKDITLQSTSVHSDDVEIWKRFSSFPAMALLVLVRRFPELRNVGHVKKVAAARPGSWSAAQSLQNWLLHAAAIGELTWEECLAAIKEMYAAGLGFGPHLADPTLQEQMPLPLAMNIAEHSLDWPVEVCAMAEGVLSADYKRSVTPVALIARSNQWASTA